jgi:hypothetical protein
MESLFSLEGRRYLEYGVFRSLKTSKLDSIFSRRKNIFRNRPVLQSTFCPAHQSAIQEAKCSSSRPTREATQNGGKFNHTFLGLRHVPFPPLANFSFPLKNLHATTLISYTTANVMDEVMTPPPSQDFMLDSTTATGAYPPESSSVTNPFTCADDTAAGNTLLATAYWIDPNGRPTARDSVSGGPLDPAS